MQQSKASPGVEEEASEENCDIAELSMSLSSETQDIKMVFNNDFEGICAIDHQSKYLSRSFLCDNSTLLQFTHKENLSTSL